MRLLVHTRGLATTEIVIFGHGSNVTDGACQEMADGRDLLEESLTLALDVGLEASGLPLPLGSAIQLFSKRQAAKAREVLLRELRSGKISASNVTDQADMGGYVLRISRAVEKGTASRNLVLMARYLFGESASSRTFDDSMEDVAILETLFDHELRCLAIAEAAIRSGQLVVLEDDESTGNEEQSKLSFENAPMQGYFPSQAAFKDALASLQRFGFVRLLPGFDAGSIRPTPKLRDFLGRLDLDGIVF